MKTRNTLLDLEHDIDEARYSVNISKRELCHTKLLYKLYKDAAISIGDYFTIRYTGCVVKFKLLRINDSFYHTCYDYTRLTYGLQYYDKIIVEVVERLNRNGRRYKYKNKEAYITVGMIPYIHWSDGGKLLYVKKKT
jgi:hypothetical protein